MIRKFFLVLSVFLLVSCVYTEREDITALSRMGGEGKAVITIDVSAMKESGFSALLPENELFSRLDRVSLELAPTGVGYPLPLSDWDVTGTANGLLSSTEVGTLLIWNPDFIRAKDGPRHYVNKESGISAGIPEDGIVLFTTSDYSDAYSALFKDPVRMDEAIYTAMTDSLAAIYMDKPETLPPLGFDIPKETVAKIESILLLLGEGDGCFNLYGEIGMDTEGSARTLCTFLRNLLIQEVRRSGERLDVKALSNIFTYEESSVIISGYKLSYDNVSALLTKEN